MTQETQKPHLNIPVVSGRFLLRILLSPFILIWGIFLTAAMMLFPMPLLCGITLFHLIGYPFMLLFNMAGAEIEIPDPFVNDVSKSYLIGYILTITIPIWGMFAIVGHFILTGKVWTGE